MFGSFTVYESSVNRSYIIPYDVCESIWVLLVINPSCELEN